MRRYWEQPGGNGSAWNTPLGAGAVWGKPTDPDTIDLRVGGIINPPSRFGVNVYTGRRSDPIRSVQTVKSFVRMHVPADAFASAGGDGNVDFMDPILHPGKIFHVTQAVIRATTVTGTNLETDDAMAEDFGHDYDTGRFGYGTFAGTITAYDLAQIRAGGQIRHALRYATAANLLKDNATIRGGYRLKPDSWPQRYQDRQMGIDIYTGNLKAGTTVGIPFETPMPPGLTKGGQALWWTMTRYPSFWRDQAGGGFHLAADQVAAADPLMDEMRKDLPLITQYLLPLRNQHIGGQPFTTSPINGPGPRVDSGPPPLAPLMP